MVWKKKRIAGHIVTVLDISYCDETDLQEIQNELFETKAVQLGLSELPRLAFFSGIETLVLTGGEISEAGRELLYQQCTLKHLVLDYEETDSDEEGIVLSRFPELQTVVSRSNLNIFHGDRAKGRSVNVEIFNWYEKGKPKKITLPDSIELCRASAPIFLSAEASSPMGPVLMRILKEYERRIKNYDIIRYSDNLDSVGIILICMKQSILTDGFGKERWIVNLARREADLRPRIDYVAFASASDQERNQLCMGAIEKALEIVSRKDNSFRRELLLQDLFEQKAGR